MYWIDRQHVHLSECKLIVFNDIPTLNIYHTLRTFMLGVVLFVSHYEEGNSISTPFCVVTFFILQRSSSSWIWYGIEVLTFALYQFSRTMLENTCFSHDSRVTSTSCSYTAPSSQNSGNSPLLHMSVLIFSPFDLFFPSFLLFFFRDFALYT